MAYTGDKKIVKENYISAAKKHFSDASILMQKNRSDNSAYLSGYVVECGLKELVRRSCDMHPRQYGHDLKALSGRVLVLASLLSSARSRACIPSSQEYRDLLNEWNPKERYEQEGSRDAVKASSRLKAAQEIFEFMIVPMILDGESL